MKKVKMLFIILALSTLVVKAQTEEIGYTPKAYIGFGSGINAFTGLLGIAGNIRLVEKTFLEAGVGIGGWGYKYSFGIRHDFRYHNTFGLGINYTGATGLENMEMEMEVNNGGTESVTLNCLHTGTIDIKGRFSLSSGRKNKFYIDLGYAIPLMSKAWEVTDGSILSDVSVQALNITQPGGVIIGLGYLFGMAE